MGGLGLGARALYRLLVPPTAQALQRLARDAAPQLSTDRVFDRVTTRLCVRLDRLKSDYRQSQLAAAEPAASAL